MHPLDPQDVIDEMEKKPKAPNEVPEFEDHRKASSRCLDQLSKFQVHSGELKRNSSIRRLQDMLESQSDTQSSVDSCYNDSVYDSDMVIVQKNIAILPRILLF